MKATHFTTFVNIQGLPKQLDTLLRFLWRCGSLKLESRTMYVNSLEHKMLEELAKGFPKELSEKFEVQRQENAARSSREAYARKMQAQVDSGKRKRKTRHLDGKKRKPGRKKVKKEETS